ncbi:S8 family peptidase [Streptomyces tritici]|uniref:S8 family peptidase n=1 Tax=Streptomyces tritici TaxID=2054410 RepID=UPI003AF01F71
MKFSLFAALAVAVPLALAPTAGAAAAPGADAPSTPRVTVARAEAGTAIKGHYIVTLKDGADAEGFVKAKALKSRFQYDGVMDGFAAQLNDTQLRRLQDDPNVLAIEEDQRATATTTQYNAPWGLDRVDQRGNTLDGAYTYAGTGTGVRAYIIDTGIDVRHSEFGDRASNVFDAFGGNGGDCNGHGTHVAGTVGGATYGVAKNVLLRGVRVLDCSGSGSYSAIISGFDWVRNNAIRPAVANASLGGGWSSAMNNAATNLANSGVHLAVAAGNDNVDACDVSPASAPGTITAAASDRYGRKASFSNWGSCTDLYAPGVGITSAAAGGGATTMSGTSMASPHISGVAALYKAAHGDASSSTVNNWLIGNSTANVIGGNVGSTPNRLLYKSTL